MNMFDEGGLKDEGGTIDPVSGNDVPSGSRQEEVRDDIPAMLSEGEFVFPADVVRYIGLEKLMMLRQEAKAGLQRMEEMGQMGNAEDATVPDDIPFTVEDLDIEEETEYNKGGAVHAQSGTYIANDPNLTYKPSQFQGKALGSEVITSPVAEIEPQNTGGYGPQFLGNQQQQSDPPTYESLVGEKIGQYDELIEFVNQETGELQRIPYKNGEPLPSYVGIVNSGAST